MCAAFGHGSDRVEVVGVVNGFDVSPMSGLVNKRHLIHCAELVQYFDVTLDSYHLFTLNETGSLYMLILSVLV